MQATLGQQLFDITVRGVRGVTEQRKQLSVVTDGSEGVYRPTIVLGSPTTASEEGRRHDARHSYATDESYLRNKAPNSNQLSDKSLLLNRFLCSVAP